MARFIIVFFLLCSLVGCSNEDNRLPQKPKVDHSTPDNLVKSLWAASDWEAQSHNLKRQQELKGFDVFTLKTRQSILAKMEASRVKSSVRVGNKIEKVDIQSQTRAIVFTTEPVVYDDNKTETIQYILTTDGKNWFVDDILSSCYRCRGTGEIEDIDKELENIKSGIFSTTNITCPICKGRGLDSTIL